LKFPQFVPAHDWKPEDAQAFRDAELNAIRQANLPGWTTGELADSIRSSGHIRMASAATVPPAHLLWMYLESGSDHQELYESSRLADNQMRSRDERFENQEKYNSIAGSPAAIQFFTSVSIPIGYPDNSYKLGHSVFCHWPLTFCSCWLAIL
jgi:hypothetical protein